MPQEEKRRTLIARWKPELDCSVDLPHTVYWSDGSPATTADYLEHLSDTHTFIIHAEGVALRMFPDLAVDVHYDLDAQQWMISGPDVEPAALNISDRNASADAILAELATWPLVYRVGRVHRRP
jgi:hypothetical protein